MRTDCVAQGTQHSAPCDLNGKETKTNVYTDSWFTLLGCGKWHNIVKQLHCDELISLKSKSPQRSRKKSNEKVLRWWNRKCQCKNNNACLFLVYKSLSHQRCHSSLTALSDWVKQYECAHLTVRKQANRFKGTAQGAMARNLLPPQNSDFYWWTTDNPTGKTNINEEGCKLKTTEEK